MKSKSITRILIFNLALVSALLACSLFTPKPTEEAVTVAPANPENTPDTASENTPTQESTSSGPCANPLYPVKVGTTWTYTSTDSASGNTTFTDTITNVREDGFTLQSQYDSLTRTQEWACKSEGLAALSLGGGPAAGINTSDVNMDLTTSNVQGVNLPKSISAGDQWPYSLDFEGTMDITGTSADAKGTSTDTFTAVGEESVTVPAGTFNAMKIHVEMVLDIQVSFSGVSAPVKFSSSSDMWYAPGIGWVKSSSSGDIQGISYSETTELQSYNIP